jgi:hypothetical protein
MKTIKLDIEEIENGLIIKVNDLKPYFFKNTWGIGKYIQDEIEKIIETKSNKKRVND